jgi:hypothetical protein
VHVLVPPGTPLALPEADRLRGASSTLSSPATRPWSSTSS